MKAFHFELVTGERGTLAGCQDDMTVDQALAALNFQFPYRVENVTESGRNWPDAAQARACVDERHFPRQLPRLADAHQEGDGPLLLLERLQNIRRRADERHFPGQWTLPVATFSGCPSRGRRAAVAPGAASEHSKAGRRSDLMGAKREIKLADGWELWSRGDLDSCYVFQARTSERIELPGHVLKALAREHFLQIVEDVTEKLAEIDAWEDERP